MEEFKICVSFRNELSMTRNGGSNLMEIKVNDKDVDYMDEHYNRMWIVYENQTGLMSVINWTSCIFMEFIKTSESRQFKKHWINSRHYIQSV